MRSTIPSPRRPSVLLSRSASLSLSHLRPKTLPTLRKHVSTRILPCASASGQPDSEIDRLARIMDSNELTTALGRAVAEEDFARAAKIRDLIRKLEGEGASTAATWHSLGLPDWLAERAEQLGYRIPTEVQRRASPVVLSGNDCLIKSGTGSGKTLSFLLPALARLDYSVPRDDVTSPQLLVLVPTRELGVQVALLVWKLFGGNISSRQPGDESNMFNFNGPRLLKVAGILDEDEAYMATDARYLKGVHVVVGLPKHVHAAATGRISLARDGPTPSTVPVTSRIIAESLKAICVDEVDECIKNQGPELKRIFDMVRDLPTQATFTPLSDGGPSASSTSFSPSAPSTPGGRPQCVLVGATVEEGTAEEAVAHGVMSDPVSVRVGNQVLPKALNHRYLVVDEGRKLAAMARLLRKELREQDSDLPPARVMVFARSEEEAKRVADPLRSALWNQHRIGVLLPSGFEPIKALQSFRDNATTLLLATPAASRGLDLPAVSHVYNLDLPEDTKQYIHRAGRSGRVGATVQGTITTLVRPEDEAALLELAASLGLTLERLEELQAEPLGAPPPGGAAAAPAPAAGAVAEGAAPVGQAESIEKLREGLEDLFNLY